MEFTITLEDWIDLVLKVHPDAQFQCEEAKEFEGEIVYHRVKSYSGDIYTGRWILNNMDEHYSRTRASVYKDGKTVFKI